MDNPWKAHQRIDALASLVASEICGLSSSVEDASGLFMRLVQTVQMNVQLGVMAPDFQKRVFERQQRIAALEVANGRQALIDQLFALNIDPAPVFADLPPGSEMPIEIKWGVE